MRVTSLPDALTARWRRLDQRVADVAAAAGSADQHQCPDAVAGALDALYDLWELWADRAQLIFRTENDAVRGDPNGETAAALVHARGAKSHVLLEFGDFTDTVAERFYDHFGCWRWQPHSDPNPRYAERDGWYGARVANHEVLPPLEAAVRWMRSRPEL